MDFIIINMNVVKIYVDISTTDAIEYFLGLLRLNSTILRIYMISVSTCDLSMQVVSGFDGLTQDLWDAAVGVLGGTQESLKGQFKVVKVFGADMPMLCIHFRNAPKIIPFGVVIASTAIEFILRSIFIAAELQRNSIATQSLDLYPFKAFKKFYITIFTW